MQINILNGRQESATKSKREVPTLKPPPNAAPFSEEWLAAIEAAGEVTDFLTELHIFYD